MNTVKITPEVEMQELTALVSHLRNRNLLLAQGVAELKAAIAERDARIAELEASAVPADDVEPEVTAEEDHP